MKSNKQNKIPYIQEISCSLALGDDSIGHAVSEVRTSSGQMAALFKTNLCTNDNSESK